MGLSDSLGTLEAGKDASFICWLEGDPLEDIHHVTGEKQVYLNGKPITVF